ncbi:magnesium transporter [Mesorhizobium sp. M2A.F.Ca.ET.037.01.1.1]|uniref:magnesium transporter n=1 Tax=unclassified Mesorhizobium TaxID=325217 RepID=UPI000F74C78F|nr:MULTISPECIES: magnesium transporter [unclassified Mesorhizobium]RVC74639.1 magnesium transporter [Mesorhizobium sp. M2A.F.Ca.ET.046.02.1.1]AZO37737.1 magnesium transporter [Mesorhizobium sp. M2A.F.Ca.ET.046.03.2.1]RUX06209.1 magnesium transporter [Mesorhizobium sp. M2A.F.Ca.ET.037.01.1.1]RWA93989.1 MAG: magnesium transporter [Mesorhizobium sp.]RWB38899.1 MAG: magnesium transporter [Mesorhizobium sp.]
MREALVEGQDRQTTDVAPAEEHHADIYGEDGAVRASFLAQIGAAIADRDTITLKREVDDLHQSELGDVLEALHPEQRRALVELLGSDFDFSALTEVDEAIRLDIVDNLPNAQIAQAVQELDSDDAVYILEDLEKEDQDEILSQLPFTERIRLRRALDYPEETAGRRMQTEFVAVPPFWTIGQTIDYMREDKNLPERFSQIFVIDPSFKLLGAIDLDQILRTRRAVKVEEVMHETLHAIPATMDQEEAAREFEQYNLLSAAVVDENGRLVGVLTIDDVVDVIQEEAEEDLLRMGGVGDEELSDTVLATSRSRVPWLLVNLLTAFLAASVIGLFDRTIEHIVALAVLMPIVAGMGGNAGSQTMTVTVRALATRDLDIYNSARIIRRELGVGFINGVVFAVLIGMVAGFWFRDPNLGGIIAAAMIINMFAAALAGILIPLVLDRFKIDPAVASAVFVTTVTDCVGFFAFLGLATWWFRVP